MGKLIFSYTDKDFIESNREASKIELDVPDDMDINEYKVVCVRLASAMGFTSVPFVEPNIPILIIPKEPSYFLYEDQ